MKKILLGLFISLALVTPAFASTHDFSQMNPTVKVTSYQKLFTDQVTAYGSGSGTIVSSDGLLITNHHVVFDEDRFMPLDAFEVCITFDPKVEPACEYTAHLIAEDKDLDIALLKLDPKDVFGQALPPLKFLNWRTTQSPKEQDRVTVVGYPASGGETITITQGQISGSETHNGYRYFKTDTKFDHGSSGGTAFDQNGNYIGIPTYLRSYAENIGYFLDLREAQSWIGENLGKTPEDNAKANQFLIRDLARLSKANSALQYTQDQYPYLSLALPAGWEFGEVNDDSLYASQKNLSTPVELNLSTDPYQYAIDPRYLKRLNEEIEKLKKDYPDYKKEDVTLAGQKAWKVSYTSSGSLNVDYYIPYGYNLVSLSYALSLDEQSDQEKAIQPVLGSLKFTQTPVSDPKLDSTVRFDDPPFSITAPNGWRIQRNPGKDNEDMLAEAVQKNNFDGDFTISYSQILKDERPLSDAERLKQKTQSLGDNKLVYKNDQVVLGGLNGFLYTYEYEGDKYQEMKKHLLIKIRNGDYEFSIEYDDLTDSFDRNLPALKQMLDSFSFQGTTSADKALHSYGNLGFTFKDIQAHPYALEISDLADKGIVAGDKNGYFRPEDPMSRGEALKTILDSKNFLEKEKGSGKEVDFSPLTGTTKPPLAPYITYAFDKKIVSSGTAKTFRATQPITLAECLEYTLKTYEIPLWNGETNPKTKKYMDKGFELGLVPFGMVNPAQTLTRAEVAFVVNRIYKNSNDEFQYGY
jgi:Trypsin-like peptidase domain/S-layer homology domain